MKKQSDWKVTNRGRLSYKRMLRLKQRNGTRETKEWYIAYEYSNRMALYHYIPEVITKVRLRRVSATLEEAPEEVRNEIMIWKMEQK